LTLSSQLRPNDCKDNGSGSWLNSWKKISDDLLVSQRLSFGWVSAGPIADFTGCFFPTQRPVSSTPAHRLLIMTKRYQAKRPGVLAPGLSPRPPRQYTVERAKIHLPFVVDS
jgi:hypothetical protein